MLILLTAAIMLICAYFYFREGLFTAVCMCVNVFLAGLIAFNFFEPLADSVEKSVRQTFLQGYEDFLCLIGVFSLALGVLRALSNHCNNDEVYYRPTLNALGAAGTALVMGYLLAGFLICAMETLPWNQNFLGFEPYRPEESPLRRVVPPDRVWLALMHRAGTTGLARGDTTFDADGTFESQYYRFRRYPD
jgi:uncharacterized membrane protein YidH (DUF202 family)